MSKASNISTLVYDWPPDPIWIKGGRGIMPRATRHFTRNFEVFDFLYVVSGRLYIEEDGSRYTIDPGQYLILAPSMTHRGYRDCPQDTDMYWLHFSIPHGFKLQDTNPVRWSDIMIADSTYTTPSRYQFQIPRYASLKQKDHIETKLAQLMEYNQYHHPDRALQQQQRFSDLLVQLQKEAIHISTSTERVAERVIAFIHQHYREPILLQELSQALQLHPDYITRCMQQTIGKSPNQYLIQYRLSLAKQLLASTNQSIASIALQVGIDDSGYFSKLYRKIEGITPTQFRRIHGGPYSE
jgi:AraC-like DNA-binding protein